MKKGFKFYVIAWAIMFILFNLAVWFLPQEFTILGATYEKFGGVSRVTLALLEACFLLHLFLTALALNRKKLSAIFYRLPLIRLSYGCVVVTLIVAVVAMLAIVPSWIPLALALLVLAVYIFAILKAEVAATLVEGVDGKVKSKTAFIRELTVDAESLMARAKTPEAKALAKKVFETVRYSDPVSVPALQKQEARILDAFGRFAHAVTGDGTDAPALAEEVLALIAARNKSCKAGK